MIGTKTMKKINMDMARAIFDAERCCDTCQIQGDSCDNCYTGHTLANGQYLGESIEEFQARCLGWMTGDCATCNCADTCEDYFLIVE